MINKFLSNIKITGRTVVLPLLISVLMLAELTVPAFGEVVPVGGKNIQEPDVTAKGAILYCVNTDKVIYSKNTDTKFLPYSITKLMTALIAAEKLPMDEKVTVSKKAAEQGGSTMSLQEGEVVTVKQLLYGTLILSGNDAAYALAETCGGTEEHFVKMMNDRAKEMGCTSTHFANPNGLTDDISSHYTTASDFLKITKAAMDNSVVKKISGTRKYSMSATNKREEEVFKTHLPLHNNKKSGVVAGKTGFWDEENCTVAVYYDKNNLEMIEILLDDTEKERPNDMKALFKYGSKVVPGFRAAEKGEVEGKLWIAGGAVTRVPVVAEKSVYSYPANNKKSSVKTKLVRNKNVSGPLKKGQTVGTLKVYTSGKLTASTPVKAARDVRKGWFPSKLYISNLAFVIILLVLLLICLLVRIRKINSARRRRKRRRKGKRRQGRPGR